MADDRAILARLLESDRKYQLYLKARDRLRRVSELSRLAEKALTMHDDEELRELVGELVLCAENLQYDLQEVPW